MKARGAWLLLLLAGCAGLPEAEVATGPAAVAELRGDGADAGAVLAYHARVRKLPGPELAREQEAARRAYAKSRSDGNRMRYALALAVPGAPAADEARAIEAMEPVARNAASPLHGLALLVTGLLQEQRRLDAQAQGLQQKLDALLELERSMTGREGGAHKKR
jgi:hypothetical protein